MFVPESVIGAIFSPNRTSVLLVQRSDVPVWVLPGGGIDPHETPEEAIQREILEETGFHVKVQRLVGAYHPINRLSRKTHLYECMILTGSAAPSAETKAVRFFPLTNLPKLIPPPFPEWIEDALIQGAPLEKHLTSVNYFTLAKSFLSHPVLVLRFLLARLGLSINT